MLPQLLRGSERREQQAASEPDRTLLCGQEPPGQEQPLSARPRLSLGWFSQLQTEGKRQEGAVWILTGAVSGGGQVELRSAGC